MEGTPYSLYWEEPGDPLQTSFHAFFIRIFSKCYFLQRFFLCNEVIFQHVQLILCCCHYPISETNSYCTVHAMGRVHLTTGKLALLGRHSLGLSREAGLLLGEVRVLFRPYRNW